MRAETLKQVEPVESYFWVANLLDEILYRKQEHEIEIEYSTDNHQLYDSVHSIKLIEDKRLRLEISMLRILINKEIMRTSWIKKQ